MSAETATSTPPEAIARQREAVDQLLARPAATSTGSIKLAGVRHDYSVTASFLPVTAGGLGDAGAPPEAAVWAW